MNKETWRSVILSASETLFEQTDYLTEIDAKFGDGDHGITIKKISILMKNNAENWNDQSIKTFLETLGFDIMNVSGGSTGTLYGSLIGGLAEALTGKETDIPAPLLKNMFACSFEAVQRITSASIGDKTMMDAFIPAVKAVLCAPDNVSDILKQAAKAAQAGSKASEGFVSKFGRAKSYKEQTIGTPDVGSVSTALLFKGFAKHFS